MKKLTIAKIQSLLNAARRKHNASEAKRAKESKSYVVKPYDNTLGYSGMKFMVRSQVFKGCNGKAMLNPINLQATSYSWWTFVTVIKNKVIFNNHNYSMTTNGHQCSVRSLMKALGIKIDVMVDTRESLSNSAWSSDALKKLQGAIMLKEYKLTKQGLSKETKRNLVGEIKEGTKALKTLNKLGFKLTVKEVKALKAETIAKEEERLADNREKSRAARAARKIMETANKSELESLEPVELYEKYDDVNSLESL